MSTKALPQITDYTRRLPMAGATHYLPTPFGFREVVVVSEYVNRTYNREGTRIATVRDNMNQLHQVRASELVAI